MKKILFIFGTRPEAIKMAPLIKELEKRNKAFKVKVCVTGQHREMLDQALLFFNIKPDYDLNVMIPGQTLFGVTSKILERLEPVIDDYAPDVVLVQGDTTSALVGAMASFYKQIKVGHLEAGLRSGNIHSPFPEEMNRILITRMTNYHFAPTQKALDALMAESVKEQDIFLVGNTVIDALLLGLKIIHQGNNNLYDKEYSNIDTTKKIILVTGHRRESFGGGFENICNALRKISKENEDVEIVYPVHLNPNVQDPVNRILKGVENIHLIKPLDYPDLISLMEKSYIVLTDSGGIQEEAPTLGKPVLVMRDVTERMEGVEAGTARLVGTNEEKIVQEVNMLLNDESEYNKMANAINPYGNGTTSKQIADILEEK